MHSFSAHFELSFERYILKKNVYNGNILIFKESHDDDFNKISNDN